MDLPTLLYGKLTEVFTECTSITLQDCCTLKNLAAALLQLFFCFSCHQFVDLQAIATVIHLATNCRESRNFHPVDRFHDISRRGCPSSDSSEHSADTDISTAEHQRLAGQLCVVAQHAPLSHRFSMQ